MKQVWILNHYAQEPGRAGGTRHFHFAQGLPEFGWRATLLAASVELNTGRQRLETGEKWRIDEIDGVPFLWVRTPLYRGNGAGRFGNMLAYSGRVLLRSTTRRLPRPDLVIGSSVHPFAAAAGLILARRHRVPFVFEVRDLWPQTLVDMGQLAEKALLVRFLRKLELFLYRRAAKIVVLLPKAAEYIVPLGIERSKIQWIPNGVDLGLFPVSPPPERLPGEVFTLMYFGAHGHANGLDTVIEAMKLVRERAGGERIRLRLIGEGGMKSELENLARRHGLENVSFEGAVPKNQIAPLAAQADAFVIAVRDLPGLYRFGISMNKLFDYLAAGRPVLMASNAANNPVAEAAAGWTVAAERPLALAEAILKLAATPLEERREMGRAGREFVAQNHDFRKLSATLAQVLDEACAAGGGSAHASPAS